MIQLSPKKTLSKADTEDVLIGLTETHEQKAAAEKQSKIESKKLEE